MVSYKRLGIGLSVLALTTVGVAGCATKGQPGGTTPPTKQSATNTTNSTPRTISSSTTNTVNSTPSNVTQNHASIGNSSSVIVTTPSKHSKATLQQSLWNPTVIQAMQYVSKNTRIPLQAPTDVQARSYDGQFYLAAQVQATNSSYNVTLQYTTTKLPVNSPKISQYPNGALATWVGGFGAKEYPTAADARKTLSQSGFNVTTSSKPEKVSLGHGIIAEVSNQHGMGIVNWHEGDWSLQVNNGTMNGDVSA